VPTKSKGQPAFGKNELKKQVKKGGKKKKPPVEADRDLRKWRGGNQRTKKRGKPRLWVKP